jgi:hypothetical protein
MSLMRTLSLLSAVTLGLTACLSDSTKPDPYGGLSCDEKIAAITEEIRVYQSSQTPTPKKSAQHADTTQADSAQSDTARVLIPIFKPWPPVVFVEDTTTGPGMVDSRDDSNVMNPTGGTGVEWIPPVGFDSTTGTQGTLPVTQEIDPDSSKPSTLPTSASVMQVVSTGAYKAHVRIFDFRNALVQEFDQDFGYHGELQNPNRRVPSGALVSYLVWNGKDAAGQGVPTGIYQWNATIELETNQVQELTTKTAYIGEECRE